MLNGNDFLYRQIPTISTPPILDNDTFKKNIIKGKFPDRKLYLPHVPQKIKKVIKKCIEPNPNDRYDNTLQIINDLASINENLDIRYGRDVNGEFWELPHGAYIYRISLIPKAGKFDIKVCKTKDGKVTNCTSRCSKNIDNTQVIPKLEAIFATL